MAQISPFRAYRYNPAKVDPARVLTQPYDKITPEGQKYYRTLSPYNLVTVEKGPARATDSPADNVYTRAARAIDDWIAAQILVRDPVASFYAYFQEFAAPGSAARQLRKGLIALGPVVDYSDGIVFRHEQTLSGPKADRLELLRHTRAHTGQLFMLYDDPASRIDAILSAAASAPPDMEVLDEYGVVHRIWRIAQPEKIAAIQSAMANKKLVIADGHHRYETALAYRTEQRIAHRAAPGTSAAPTFSDAPYEKVMMTLVNARSNGLVILPTHRVIAGLAKFDFVALRTRVADFFDAREVSLSSSDAVNRAASAREQLAAAGRSGLAIGAYAGGDRLTIFTLKPSANLASALPGATPRQRELDVFILHGLILDKGLGITAEAVRAEQNLRYERDAAAAISDIAEGRAQVCFLLNPVRVEQVMEMALSGEVLPQKSTDFYPKMLSGVAIYRLED
ncbi:MAG TPA: DUF1015 domain-containing protein [Candidatus Acidoferrales bacterium]|nr:DUF1015 domain-containing protein [Candidatus Acidoferrales bacterium]